MARTYSEKFLISVQKLDDSEDGVVLAKLCIMANLPAHYVAEALGVSRMTIHSWFRGSAIRRNNLKSIKEFMLKIDDAFAEGSLPANNMAEAKEFTDKVRNELNTIA